MKAPIRVTIALDEETSKLFEKLLQETKSSQSGLIRRSLQFYSENRGAVDKHGTQRINTYVDMLGTGEHVILDVDHWLLFLKLVDSSPEKEKFWEDHKKVAKSHAEQLPRKISSVEEMLERLDACNFYTLSKSSENEYTLVLYSDATKKFVKIFLEEVLTGMGFKVEIKEDFAKLRVKILK